ncbi:transcriptional regulator, AsnC family [Mycolicibacterium rhodesiae JS60]|nr:transcriptional regulator, AsnC family [Mycolicibacterium rhodesiae JS60]
MLATTYVQDDHRFGKLLELPDSIRHMSGIVNLDSVDWAILAALQDDAMISNKHLAQRVRLSTSACHDRVRRLRDNAVITGITATVDPNKAGRPLQAFIAVQLRPHRRDLVEAFTAAVRLLPETLALYNVSGPEDFFIHVAVTDSEHLQQLIMDHLATRPEVGHAQTHLIYGAPIRTPVRPAPA